MPEPYLSVVCSSRNDDHGGDPLRRTQIFINTFARQCERYNLPAEIVIVDWNPVPGRPGLSAVLQPPPEAHWCQLRAITVPSALHQRLKYARLPFFQMIAKNAGVRRARGRFVLATNIDIIFSDELIRFIAQQNLDPARQYRVDRYDIEAGLSEHLTLDETIAYAWAHPIRQHKRFGPKALIQHLYGRDEIKGTCTPLPDIVRGIGGVSLVEAKGVWGIESERAAPIDNLHTNACGDFTLMSREAWQSIRGYPEFAAYSFNIDSMGIVAAHYAGYQEVALLPPLVCFHIEHSLGSGWTPQGEKALFARLRESGILNPEWPVLLPLVDQMRREQRALEFNHAGWGLADFELPEQAMGDTEVPVMPDASPSLAVAAINPAYDLDHLTLMHERKLAASAGISFDSNEVPDIVQLFPPAADGGYSEETSLMFHGQLTQGRSIAFHVKSCGSGHAFRLDPVARAGLVIINSVTFLDVGSGRELARFDGRQAGQCVIGGSAIPFTAKAPDNDGAHPIYLLSNGDDPQILLPPLVEIPLFPLLVLVDLRFIASVGA